MNRVALSTELALPMITNKVLGRMERRIADLGNDLAALLEERWDGAPDWQARLEAKMEELKDAIESRSAWIDEVREHLDRCDVATARLLF